MSLKICSLQYNKKHVERKPPFWDCALVYWIENIKKDWENLFVNSQLLEKHCVYPRSMHLSS